MGPGVKLPWLFFARRGFWGRKVPPPALEGLAQGPAPGEAAEVSAERARALSQVGGVRAIGLCKQRRSMAQVLPSAVPQLAPYPVPPQRAPGRLWAARHSQGEAQPQGSGA